ncbi:FAD-binding oxidoreductase [Bosea sp. 47.2.35]|uniref:NAD(P)/FAD-dependent oxidoreductase n=1 Tax=Bosea sp. 47.2.35 TaxID=2969304 RepID=UPI0021503AF5|nr:FAD-binding oxidoreductase [Bosea sp. 47.2.35]MCR4520031.1 FAD-binding oxidoreductase [Bosea sp. 47.2.35]
MSDIYDLAVIGGGIMGSAAACRAAAGGMRVIVIEQQTIGSGASGVNAGTLSLQIKRVKLMPYAVKGHELWEHAGAHVGFHKTGGITLAFNQREADLLHERMALKREAGAPIELISPARVAELEPNLSRKVVAASWSAEDGYANASLTGAYYRARMETAGVAIREHTPVTAIDSNGGSFELATSAGPIRATRLLLACGAWLKSAAAMIGLDLPVRARVNTVSVTERGPPLVGTVIGHATGLLTLKQKPNGSVLIGGGWQGTGSPEQGRGCVDPETLLPNLRLAMFAVPGLDRFRVVRSWTGFEANVPDFYPLAGAAPGIENAFLLGCVRGGYTIGPYIGALMGDLILGREPELPLFDPGRFANPAAAAA